MARKAFIAAAVTLLAFNSGLLMFASAAPVFYLYCISGRRAALVSALVSIAATAAMAAFWRLTPADLLFMGYFLLIGVLLGEGVLRRTELFRLVASSVFVPFTALAAVFLFVQFAMGFDVVGRFGGYFTAVTEQTLKMQEGMASLTPPQAAYLKENAGRIVSFAVKVLPSFALLFTMFVASVTLLLGRVLTRRLGSLEYLGNVTAAHFPFWPVWILIASASVYFADAYVLKSGVAGVAAMNGLFFSVGIFFVEGCFVVSFWLHRGRSPFLRLLVYGVIIMFLQVMGFIIIALGLSDQWLDYRRRYLKQTVV